MQQISAEPVLKK